MKTACHGEFDRDVISEQPCPQSGVLDANLSGPICHCFGNSVPCDEPIGSHVISLLSGARPSTVSRFVVAVLIWIPIKRIAVWSLTHVGAESNKAVVPSVADFNSSTTIQAILVALGVIAAISTTQPSGVLGCLFAVLAATASVLVITDRPPLVIQTATTASSTVHEAVAVDAYFLSAVASAQPVKTVAAIRGPREHCQAAKYSASQVYQSHG